MSGRALSSSTVLLRRVTSYDRELVSRALPRELFDQIGRGDRVVLKPNWVLESHQHRPNDWDYVITHPVVVSAVLDVVIERLAGSGRISVLDGPTTEASFRKLLARYPVGQWKAAAAAANVELEIIDLRDWEWEVSREVVVRRKRLSGDPRGKTEIDLMDAASEFHQHKKSARGYYGADYDIAETNRAHDGHHNLYRVSRTVLEADVFVNLPKLKTHRKAGITCCLKNLVGINTYKNFLPHHSLGGPSDGGDQFPVETTMARAESRLGTLRHGLLREPRLARVLSPLDALMRRIFGKTSDVIRSGNWHGNDTIWRMILDLNKVLLYGNPDGSMRHDVSLSAKRYIGVVDAIIGGEGHGPLCPDPVRIGALVAGDNPVAIDAVCARLMGFDPVRIPSIARAFEIKRFPLCNFSLSDVVIDDGETKHALAAAPTSWVVGCEPQFGWKGRIEKVSDGVDRAR